MYRLDQSFEQEVRVNMALNQRSPLADITPKQLRKVDPCSPAVAKVLFKRKLKD
jgi:hypothetical protein